MLLTEERLKKIEPIRVGDLVIDHKKYKALKRKLRGFLVTENVEENQFVIEYEHKKHYARGRFVLFDLSGYFPAKSKLPQLDEINA